MANCDSKFEQDIRDAFVVSEESLKKINGLLTQRIGNTSITAECADSIAREFNNLDDLLKFENPKSKRILNLNFYARSDDFKKSARVSFTDKWHFGGIRISIEARDDVVTRLRSDLLDIIAGIRPWYFVLNKIDVFLVAILCYGVIWLSLLIYIAIRQQNPVPISVPSSQGSAKAQLFIYGFTGLFFLVAYIIHRFRRILFPHGSFVIGQEKDRFEILEKWRWGFVISFFASFVAGIFLLWFQ